MPKGKLATNESEPSIWYTNLQEGNQLSQYSNGFSMET